MKNKKTIYILLPVVLLLWALIAYQVVQYLNKDDDTDTVSYTTRESVDEDEQETDEYELLLNYRDPFLKQPVSRQPKNQSRNIRKVRDQFDTREDRRNRNVRWPSITYHGIITNEENNTAIAFLMINEEQIILGEGEKAKQVHVQSVYPDSIIVEYEEEQKTIKKLQ